MPSTSSSISRWAAKLIISRNRSASGVFSTTARRFMMSLVIGSSSNQVDVHNPTVPGIIDDHPAKPLPRYSALWGALARGFATAELHHSRGPDLSDLPFFQDHMSQECCDIRTSNLC